ncbi:maleylpyruvate isomerase family mycothiol-dependent enzyme [Arthrobacter sp. 35W]|uniref:maleylpyruvate isomerase family mycothiol-dependent enzyme n=1 Tax=Arthrobacter sp. 35W TaxID=1132441 RepID=UPI000409798B|nr:maleylpyruvate isomerase family mycothiol-dependent enzyme [Arthrobacter sp. 35W]
MTELTTPGSAAAGSSSTGSSAPTSARPIEPADLLDRLAAAADTLSAKAKALSDADIRTATELPGWTRGHVLAHLCGVANGFTRQVEYAQRGESIELYDGGPSGRNQAIEMAAGHTAAEHSADLDAALERLLKAFGSLDDDGWQLPIAYRGGVAYDGALALWRELVIHLADLGVGRGPETWSKEFCLYLFDFLTPRVPADTRLKLLPLGMAPLTLGAGEKSVSVSGMITDIAAWLAGRTPTMGTLRAEAAADSVPLPVLGPWPSPAAK